MDLTDILKYEDDRVEFKLELPKQTIKYAKPVVGFANASGGWLLRSAGATNLERVSHRSDEIEPPFRLYKPSLLLCRESHLIVSMNIRIQSGTPLALNLVHHSH